MCKTQLSYTDSGALCVSVSGSFDVQCRDSFAIVPLNSVNNIMSFQTSISTQWYDPFSTRGNTCVEAQSVFKCAARGKEIKSRNVAQATAQLAWA